MSTVTDSDVRQALATEIQDALPPSPLPPPEPSDRIA